MKMSQVIGLDMRIEGNEEKLREALTKLPFFGEDSVTLEDIEKAIKKMQKKYPIKLAYISISEGDDVDEEPPYYYSCMIKRTDDHKHVKTVWGVTLFEALAKVAILMYGYIKSTLQKEGTQ